jgi:hypothetical protein
MDGKKMEALLNFGKVTAFRLSGLLRYFSTGRNIPISQPQSKLKPRRVAGKCLGNARVGREDNVMYFVRAGKGVREDFFSFYSKGLKGGEGTPFPV